jgi:hypothetical protein
MLCRECATTSIRLPPLSRAPPPQRQPSSHLQENRRTGSPHRRRGDRRSQLAGQEAAMRENLDSLHSMSTDAQSIRPGTARTRRVRDTTEVRSAGRTQVDHVQTNSSESRTRRFPSGSSMPRVQPVFFISSNRDQSRERPALNGIGLETLTRIVNHGETDE